MGLMYLLVTGVTGLRGSGGDLPLSAGLCLGGGDLALSLSHLYPGTRGATEAAEARGGWDRGLASFSGSVAK